jgi:hypothetical protein
VVLTLPKQPRKAGERLRTGLVARSGIARRENDQSALSLSCDVTARAREALHKALANGIDDEHKDDPRCEQGR